MCPAFRFKQFSIHQDRCPMKVGTDGVLVGAWARVEATDRRLLDIGTGTGLIALMLAQRAPAAYVMGVDLDEVAQARENAAASPWAVRVSFEQTRVQEFTPDEGFDLIVSNPPFFVDSLTCPDPGRTTARHAVSLSFEELRDAVVRLLKPGGRFVAVLPTDVVELFISLCDGYLTLNRRTDVQTTPRRQPKRALLELVATAELSPQPELRRLTIGTGEHECYTPEYIALTRDFYLKF